MPTVKAATITQAPAIASGDGTHGTLKTRVAQNPASRRRQDNAAQSRERAQAQIFDGQNAEDLPPGSAQRPQQHAFPHALEAARSKSPPPPPTHRCRP